MILSDISTIFDSIVFYADKCLVFTLDFDELGSFTFSAWGLLKSILTLTVCFFALRFLISFRGD